MPDQSPPPSVGESLTALSAARLQIAQASLAPLRAAIDQAEAIPLGQLPDLIQVLLPLIPDGHQAKRLLSMMAAQTLPTLPNTLRAALAAAEQQLEA